MDCRKWCSRLLLVACIVGGGMLSGANQSALYGASATMTVAAQEKFVPRIQIAILLDTSGSMEGLITQAKTQLWNIVNDLATAQQNGVRPRLEVALYEYGKASIAASEGHLRQILPLTNDLDKVSEELFKLKTNGGDEYCGQVITSAVNSLQWSQRANDLKAIYIAGNEPFTQGKVDYRQACPAAIRKGITVNTIHCGNRAEGVRGKWQDGARLADGVFINIDQNRIAPVIKTPYDNEITRLGGQLNTTYIPYGKKGKAGKMRQKAQDKNAVEAAGGQIAQRMAAKSSSYYTNSRWDLVDALKEKNVKLENLKKDALPEVMQNMNPAERKVYVEQQQTKRVAIQQKIRDLSAKRQQYITTEMKKNAVANPTNLDDAMIKGLRKQATKKGFVIK